MTRYLLACVLLVLAGTALADTEYTGGSVTAVNGERYYLTQDVTITNGQTLAVGAGVSIEFDGQGFAILSGSSTGTNWDWITVASGGYAHVHDISQIEEDISIYSQGDLRLVDVWVDGPSSGDYNYGVRVNGWAHVERCGINSQGYGWQPLHISGGRVFVYDSLLNYDGGNTSYRGAYAPPGTSLHLYRSTIISNVAAQAYYARGDSSTVVSCIMQSAGGTYVYQTLGVTVSVHDYNCYYNTGSGTALANLNGTVTDTPDANGVYTDPTFVGSGSFALQSGSDCIDAGTGTRTYDLAGNTGVVNSVVDIGAYEYQTGGCTIPTAAFSGTPTSGSAPLTVDFTDSSADTPTSWKWYFGDGDSSSTQNPSHDYAAGTYDVTLIATNACGSDTLVKSSYITASTGVSGACCTSGGLGNAGSCAITVEESCSGFWFADEICSPDPCYDTGDFVDVYNVAKTWPRIVPQAHLDRLTELYNGGDVDPSVPSEIQTMWSKMITRTSGPGSGYMFSPVASRVNPDYLTLMAATWTLTQDTAVRDSFLTTIDYMVENVSSTTTDTDGALLAWDVMRSEMTDEQIDGLLTIAYNTWGSNPYENSRVSGSYNLRVNEAWANCAWVIWFLGVAPATDSRAATFSSLLNDSWSRIMGEDPDNTDNGFYTWLNAFWPEFEAYPKGTGYGLKYLGDGGLNFPWWMKNTGLSEAPADSIMPVWDDGAMGKYERVFRQPSTGIAYMASFINSFGVEYRRLGNVAGYSLLFRSSPWASYMATEGAHWEIGKDTNTWGRAAILIPPDSISAPFNPRNLQKLVFFGREGTGGRRVGYDDWYDFAVVRFGAEPWEEIGDAGYLFSDAGYVMADNWSDGRGLRIGYYHDGTLINPFAGWYEDPSPEQYPDFTSASWGTSTICVLETDDPTATDAFERVGPWQMGTASSGPHANKAGPITDWINDGSYEKGDLTAAGADSSQSFLAVYIEGTMPDSAYRDPAYWDVTNQRRRQVGIFPNGAAGRGLLVVRDEVDFSASRSPEDGTWSNIQLIHQPTITGTIGTTWPVAGSTRDIYDYSSVSYIDIARDTTVVQSGTHEFSAHGRITPLSGHDYVREIWGPNTFLWMYEDVDDPVATGHNALYGASWYDDRFNLYQGGGGRIEIHSADGAQNTDILWMLESHAEDEEGTGYSWVTPTLVTSSEVAGVVMDSVCVIIPDSPNSGGPWDFTFSGSSKDIVIAGLPDGNYQIGQTVKASADSLLIFPDVDGGALTLYAGSGLVGACCDPVSGACEVLIEIDCDGGVYQGDGTDCSPNPCTVPTGACCVADTLCYEALTQTVCEDDSLGAWFPGSTCTEVGSACAPVGACCFSSDLCLNNFTRTNCESNDGTFYYGQQCNQITCPAATGACCVGPTCYTLTQTVCETDSSGVYIGNDVSCSPDPCAEEDPEGACCTDAGVCTVTTEALCDAAGSTYQGDDESCVPNPCTPLGQCCDLTDGTCTVVVQASCTGSDKLWQNPGQDCDPDPCPQLVGACCLMETPSVCVITTETLCGVYVGVFQGGQTTCDPDPCTGYFLLTGSTAVASGSTTSLWNQVANTPMYADSTVDIMGTVGHNRHMLCQFELPTGFSAESIVAAEVEYYVHSVGTSSLAPSEIYTYRVIPDVVIEEATWNESSSGVDWSIAGATDTGTDRALPLVSYVDVVGAAAGDTLTVVSGNRGLNLVRNYLFPDGEVTLYTEVEAGFIDIKGGNSATPPKMTITYVTWDGSRRRIQIIARSGGGYWVR